MSSLTFFGSALEKALQGNTIFLAFLHLGAERAIYMRVNFGQYVSLNIRPVETLRNVGANDNSIIMLQNPKAPGVTGPLKSSSFF